MVNPHYQDRSVAQPFCPRAGRNLPGGDRYAVAGGSLHDRQDDVKRSAAEIGSADPDLTAMLLDNIAHDRQAKPGPLAVRLGRVERLEDLLTIGLGDPGPRI